MSTTSEREVAVVAVREKKPGKGFIVTVPKNEVAARLELNDGQRVRVLIDIRRRRFVYELLD